MGNAFIDPECLAAFRVSPEAATAKLGHAQASSFRRFVHRVSGDPLYRVGKFDILSGNVLSYQWCLLRNTLLQTYFAKGRTRLRSVRSP